MKPGWTEVALGDVCEVVLGQAPPGDSYNELGDGLPLVAGAGDFAGGGLAPKKYTTAPTKVSQPGDIVLSIRASIGARVRADGTYCLGRGVAGLRPGRDLDARYLWHWIDWSGPALAAKGKGATFLQVNRKDISEMELQLPPLEEQKRIAAILDKADDLLAKRRASIAHLDSLTQASFSQRFRELMANGNPVELDTVIDADRPVCYGILMPGPDLEDGRPYVRVVDMQDGGIGHEQVRRTSPEIDHQYRRSRLSAGDLVMSIRGHVGRLAVVPPELDGANITQDSARLAVSGADSRFVLEQLRHPMTQEWMRRNTKGAAVRGLNIGDLRRVPIFLAPMPEQEAFAAVCRQVDLEAQPTREAAKRQNELTATLQSRAFRGEL